MVNVPYRIGGNRYEIQSLIGRGGMAEVYRAVDVSLSRTVAIKMLRTDLAKDAIFLARFRREAQSSANLNHENIVGVYDTGEEPINVPDGSVVNIPYIVMEYVEGNTVHELLTDGQPVPIREAAEIVEGILNALEYSHRHGLVHRDIKPGNIMLTNDGKIKVMDFGIARAMDDSGATMTKTDAVVGTAQYLSPEQARGETVDTRSDLYSCGCMLFELLTGRPPFRGDSPVSVAYQHVAEQPPLPSSITHDISPVLDQMVMKSLAKNPQDRYQSAAVMRQALLAAIKGETIPEATLATSRFAPVSSAAADATMATTTFNPVNYPARADNSAYPWSDDEPVDNRQELEQKAKAKKRKQWIIFGILTTIALAAVLFAVYVVNYGGGEKPAETVTVPNLTGKTFAQAKSILDQLELTAVKGEDVVSEEIEKGKVAETNPPAGQQIQKNSEVTIRLSAGPSKVHVPDLKGQSQESARNMLEELGLKVGSVITKDDPEIPAGQVVASDPGANTLVAKDAEISLIVSSGYVEISASEIVGISAEEAVAKLEKMGLSVTRTRTPSSTAKPGTVLNVSPSGRLKQGSSILIEVAEAAPEVNNNPSTGGSDNTTKPGTGDTSGKDKDKNKDTNN